MLFSFSFSATSATEMQISNIQQAAQDYIINTVPQPQGGTLEAKVSELDRRIFATDCPGPYLPPLLLPILVQVT